MTGAEYIAEFLFQRGISQAFVITGGACTFIVDAIGRHKEMSYKCFHHEQAAAMAADAVWRTNKVMGATVVTSGPGATNLITGIACSYFDSIPSIHITGQVNQNEKANYKGSNVRQAGFQETKIVEMVRPITKYAVQVTNGEELKHELNKAYNLALSGRMGPVVIDVPMDVQKEEVGDQIFFEEPKVPVLGRSQSETIQSKISAFLGEAKRPLILVGAGVGLAGAEREVFNWIGQSKLPFVSSWNGLTYFDHDMFNYGGNIGVYGNRGANFLLQNCDRLLVLGSRLDNRQRSGNTKSFAMSAKVMVVDVDSEELKKYSNNVNHETVEMHLGAFSQVSDSIVAPNPSKEWMQFFTEMKELYFGKYPSSTAEKYGTMSPYAAVQQINRMIEDDAVVVADDGANLCWVFQAFHRKRQTFFTAGGNSPMAYSMPAAIGAAFYNPDKQIICFTGDGSLQMNIQEFQTLKFHDLNVKIFVLNNFGYGIIKQFQDLYFESRYHATGDGYSQPDFKKVTEAYGLAYRRVDKVDEISPDIFTHKGPMIIDLVLHPSTLIEPKLEMGRSIEDQFPYLSDEEYERGMIHSVRKSRDKKV